VDQDSESVVCIIEAMKVMNEIKAEVKGTIRKGPGGKRHVRRIRPAACSWSNPSNCHV
jgi:hypothetical protein